MEENFNNNQDDFLWALLANPANNAHLYTFNLQRLVNDFPQSGVLQALLAHSSDEKNLRQASAYFNPKALYKLINAPSSFTAVSDENIIIQNSLRGNSYRPDGAYHNEAAYAEQHLLTDHNENYFNDPSETTSVNSDHTHTTEHEAHEPLQVNEHSHLILDRLPENEIVESVDSETNTFLPETEHEVLDQVSESYAFENITQGVHELLPKAEHEVSENVSEERPIESVVQESHEILPKAEHKVLEHIEEEHQIENIAEGGHELLSKTAHEVSDYVSEEHPIESVVKEGHDLLPEAEYEASDHVSEEHPLENITHQTHELLPGEEHEVSDQAHADSIHEVEEQGIMHHELTLNDEHLINGHFLDHHESDENIGTEHQHQEEGIEAHGPEKLVEENTYDEIAGAENIAGNSTDYLHENVELSNADTEKKHEDAIFIPDADAKEWGEENYKIEEPVFTETEHQDISKYNDEKMPYTFMWWLDKTRREHAGVSQPYAKPDAEPEAGKTEQIGKSRNTADELQQQYYENIFQLTSVDELDRNTAPYAPIIKVKTKRKEESIIERFIEEEPQIKPQSSDKLDNENKAKKSSEDKDELVTETLAAIYADQMLYHKAIASYRKLMLKFPEKSSYFASKIEQLEKKTN